MIYGIGVDCVLCARLEKSLQNPRFAQRVFSARERALLAGLAPVRAAERAAACFAAKEAFLKAAGRGLGGFSLGDVAALRRAGGAPYFALAGEAAAFCEANGLVAHLSLTHEGGVATAFVVLERCEGRA